MTSKQMAHPKMLAFGSFLCLLAAVGCGAASDTSFSSPSSNNSSSGNGVSARQDTSAPSGTLNRMLETSYQVGFRTTSSWSGGYVGELTITYTGATPISGWNLSFDLPNAQLNSVWNARQLSRNGVRFVLQNESYNATINPGQSVTVGFVAAFTGTAAQPTSFGLEDLTQAPDAGGGSGNPGSSQVAAVFTKDNDWGSGFVGGITLTNNGATPVTDWSLTFQSSVTLDNAWNGVLVSQSGGQVKIGAQTYNKRIEPGQQVRIGFQGRPGNPTISNISVTPTTGTASPTSSPTTTPTTTPTSTPTSTPTTTPTTTPTPTTSPTTAPPTAGYLHTQGAQLLDSEEKVVILRGINWFGLETNTFAPHGLWTRSMDSMLDQVAGMGFNCLRLPYSDDIFKSSSVPNGIDFNQNPDLRNLSALQVMDKVIEKAGARGIKTILDRHRPDKDGQSPLWYTPAVSEEVWIQHWEALAQRYKNNPNVIGCDLHNEPHSPATWGSGNVSNDWRLAAERAGNRILAVNPNLLIVVEGVDTAGGSSYWWGGNLKGAASAPVRLNTAGRLVYQTHDYPDTVYNQSWFSDPSFPNNLAPLWDATWGYLVKNQTAPVLVGEFGSFYQANKEKTWMNTLIQYIRINKLSYTYWCLNPNSNGTGGLLKDDWRTVEAAKLQALQPILTP